MKEPSGARNGTIQPSCVKVNPPAGLAADSGGYSIDSMPDQAYDSLSLKFHPSEASIAVKRNIPAAWAVFAFLPLVFVIGCGESIPDVEGIEVELNDETFDEHVSDSSVPVLVDFGANWCGPCRSMEPAIAYLSVQYKDRLSVAKVDVDESYVLGTTYAIESLPTFVIFQNGKEVDRSEGTMSYRRLSAWADEYVTP